MACRPRGDGEAAAAAAAHASSAEADAHALLAAAATGDLAALRPILLAAASPVQLNHLVKYTTYGHAQPTSALFAAAFNGHNDCVSALISAGIDVDIGCDNGTPLMAASFIGYADCVATLLAAGSDVNARSADSLNLAAIHCATRPCQVDIVPILLAAGADVNALSTPSMFRGGGSSPQTPIGLLTVTWEDPDPNARLPVYARGLERADFLQLLHRKRRELVYYLLRAGADISYFFEDRPAEGEGGPTWRQADGLVEFSDYFQKIHAAGGFSAYALLRQYQLTTIKLLARGCGRLNLPADVTSIIQEFWAEKPRSA